MQITTLGRTNLKASRMGVGAGGPSQLGRKTGLTAAESAALLRRAFDRGTNFVDTAEGYGTEPIIGQALKGRDRTSIIISTKKSTRRKEVTPQTLQQSLDQSLEELQAAGVGEEWASWSGGFISTERWVETLHRSQ